MKRTFVTVLIAALPAAIAFLSGPPARASQPISGNYAPGAFTGMKGAVTPPKGTWVVENGTLYYNTRQFVDSSGNETATDPSDALANRTIIGYVPEWDVLGGRYLPAIIIPLANAPIRPEPGSEKEFQFADLILQPVAIGWTQESMHYQVAYNIWLPTAKYSAGAADNVGKGLYSHLFSGGVTWIQPESDPWSTTLMVRYELMGGQKDTDINPGDNLIIEGGTGKEVIPGLDLGLTYFYLQQVTEESGSPPGTDTSRVRVAGVGPEINWRPDALPGLQAGLRVYFDAYARNSSQGIFTVFSLAYMF